MSLEFRLILDFFWLKKIILSKTFVYEYELDYVHVYEYEHDL